MLIVHDNLSFAALSDGIMNFIISQKEDVDKSWGNRLAMRAVVAP
jgi:hypothetical protein